jgi:hypothetical protein
VTKYTVTIRIDAEHGDAFEAAHGAYRMLSSLLASPAKGPVMADIENHETGETVTMSLFDGVIDVDPLFASQVMGFRHLIWVSQNPPRANRSPASE